MHRFLHQLLPRSLRTRLILLTLGIIFLVQAATLATVTHFRQKFTEEVTVEITATTIRTLRASLAQIPASERSEFVRNASHNEWHLWSRSLPQGATLENRAARRARSERHEPNLPRNLRHDLRLFIKALNIKLNDGTRVGLSRGPTPQLYISLLPSPDNDDDTHLTREWLVIPLDQISPSFGTPAVVAWLGGMGLFLLISAAFSWHITRPLTSLAKAADQLAAGQPQRVTPSGPTETRILGERFNAMLDTLAESNAVRHTLLTGLPHDLKGPLSRMWLRIEMIDDSTFKDGMRNDIQDMQRMINQFIGFARGSDPATYHFTPLNLNVWLEEQVSAWESTGTTIQLAQLWPEPLSVNADRVALGRLLDNLITNALNYAAPPITIALTADAHDAIITVSDCGPGISEQRRAEALRPFSRLDDARTLTGSVGLGLALANTIALAHNGTLTLGQAESGGLQVTVTLPLTKAPTA